MLLSFVAAVVPAIGVDIGKGGAPPALLACSCSGAVACWCQFQKGVAGAEVSPPQRDSMSGCNSDHSGLTACS